jgi:hypothetical protein
VILHGIIACKRKHSKKLIIYGINLLNDNDERLLYNEQNEHIHLQFHAHIELYNHFNQPTSIDADDNSAPDSDRNRHSDPISHFLTCQHIFRVDDTVRISGHVAIGKSGSPLILIHKIELLKLDEKTTKVLQDRIE